MRKISLLFIAFALLLTACGGKQPTPVGQPQPPGGPPPTKAAPPPGGPGQPPSNQPGPPSPPPHNQPGGAPPPTGQPVNPSPGGAGEPASTPDSGMAMYTEAQSTEVLPRETYLAQVVTETPSASAWRYVTTLFGTMEAGQLYDVGGFCRVFPAAAGTGYDVTFGGAFNLREMDESRRYEGDVRRTLSADLSAWGAPQQFAVYPGDYAIDTDGQFYYLLNAHPEGWRLGKYDADFQRVQEVIVRLPDGHAANDPMLRVWDGRLYLSDIYNPNNADMHSNKDAGADETLYTHVWVYDTALNPLEDHILDEESNINGGTLIPYGDGFAYVTADNFLRNNLKAFLYDADWNFLGSVLLEENGQWSMGGTVADGKIYIAYHRGEHSRGDVMLDIFDLGWNRLEQIPVTAVAQTFNAQRPWVLLDGDRLFVAYDMSGGGPGMLNLQCMVNVYERR